MERDSVQLSPEELAKILGKRWLVGDDWKEEYKE